MEDWEKRFVEWADKKCRENKGDFLSHGQIKQFIKQERDLSIEAEQERICEEIKDACSDYYFIGDGSDNTAGENEAMEISEFIIKAIKG